MTTTASGKSQKPLFKRTGIWVAIIGAVGLIAAATITAVSRGGDTPTAAPTVTITSTPPPTTVAPVPPPPVERSITQPESAERVPICNVVQADVPDLQADKSLVIADRQDGDGLIYFTAEVALTTPGKWEAVVYLGDEKEPPLNIGFSVWAIIMDKADLEYLEASAGRTIWHTKTFPPNADVGQPVRVTGNGSIGKC
jgi:hypothetical protein